MRTLGNVAQAIPAWLHAVAGTGAERPEDTLGSALAGPTADGGQHASPVARTSYPLHPTAYFIVLATLYVAFVALLLLAAVTDPVRSDIGIGPGTPGIVAGVAFWTLLAFATSFRGIPMPGGAFLTLSLAPLLAATLLGGPLAGGIIAMLGVTEIRELRGDIRWFVGAQNHVGIALPVVLAGFAMDAIALGSSDPLPIALAAGIGAAVMIVGNDLLIEASIPHYNDRHLLRMCMRTWVLRFALGALGWLAAEMVLHVAWWSILVFALPLVAVRDAVQTGEVRRLNDELARVARVDPLTGLGNRLRLNEDLAALAARLARRGGSAGLVLLDLDRFKAINDMFGHLAGDDALRRAAETLRANARSDEGLYRYGGEEFLLVLPTCDAQELTRAGQRLVAALAAAAIPHPDNAPWDMLTASAGAALIGLAGSPAIDDALRAADTALFQAKDAGRNRAASALGDAGTQAELRER